MQPTREPEQSPEKTRNKAMIFDAHSTTILAVRRNGAVAMGGDGQVTLGNTVMKGNARKVRRLCSDKVLAGFAGGTADAFTLYERFEGKLEKYGNLTRAAIGSGGSYALAAALALLESSQLPARAIVERALSIAADICIYTNRNLVIDELT